MASKSLTKNKDVILIDKDYDYWKMKVLLHSVKLLYRKEKNLYVDVEVGTSFNEIVSLSDLIAGLGRLKILAPRKITEKALSRGLELFK